MTDKWSEGTIVVPPLIRKKPWEQTLTNTVLNPDA